MPLFPGRPAECLHPCPHRSFAPPSGPACPPCVLTNRTQPWAWRRAGGSGWALCGRPDPRLWESPAGEVVEQRQSLVLCARATPELNPADRGQNGAVWAVRSCPRTCCWKSVPSGPPGPSSGPAEHLSGQGDVPSALGGALGRQASAQPPGSRADRPSGTPAFPCAVQ